MGDVIDGLSLTLSFLSFVVMLAFMAFWFTMVGRFMREALSGLNPTLARDPPSAKVMVRRLYCRHRLVARVKNSWGLNYTACTGCGVDVNRGKRKEDWR